MAKNKFYEFKNVTDTSQDLYVYGVIVNGADKWDESDVTFTDFKNTLEKMTTGSTLNIYINSPGGSVFTTDASISMLRRAKENGIKVNAYIDGLAASCGSWLPMVADEIFIYPQSIMMIHKPLCCVYGNADEMQKEIEVLNKIENDVIVPLYMDKAKEGVTEDIIKDKMTKETWLNATEIQEMFNVTLLEDKREITCCVDREVFNQYSNVPKELLDEATKENSEEEPVVEPTKNEGEQTENKTKELEDKIINLTQKNETLTKDKGEVETKLNEANETIIALNKEVSDMKPLVEELKTIKVENQKVEDEKALEELTNEYKEKFDMLNASKKFESNEVQDVLKEAIKDEGKKNTLNAMIVDLIKINNKDRKSCLDSSVEMDNLVPVEEKDGAKKYGFN